MATGAKNAVKLNPSAVGYGRPKYNAGNIAPETRATVPGHIPGPMPEQYENYQYLDELVKVPEGDVQGVWGIEVPGIGDPVARLNSTLQQILVAIKMTQPSMQCFIWGGDEDILASQPTELKFMLGTHPVPALKLVVQNNSASTIYLGLAQPASLAGIQLLPSGLFDSIVNIKYLSLFCQSTVGLSGVNGVFEANSVVVQAWSNPEWIKTRGAF
jgi:hypothetical protein